MEFKPGQKVLILNNGDTPDTIRHWLVVGSVAEIQRKAYTMGMETVYDVKGTHENGKPAVQRINASSLEATALNTNKQARILLEGDY